MRLTWVQPEDLLAHELRQARAEGADVAGLAERWIRAGGSVVPPLGGTSAPPSSGALRRLADELLDAAAELPRPPAGAEPDELEDIRRTWSEPPVLSHAVDRETLLDKIHGAWLGRAAGCLLGKPVEKIPRLGIREILESSGRWPLDNYFTGDGLPRDVAERWPWNRRSRLTSLREVIAGMPEDDDLNFSLLALRIVEDHGGAFTTDDVAAAWLNNLPAGRVFTAERIAYRNLLDGLDPPATARRRNPFREWIGAQIRADLYGWIRPGRPREAAELAWRDARLSHTRNGLYGSMFVAAMSAAAVVSESLATIIDAGLSVIPPGSQLAAAVHLGREVAASEPDPERAMDRLEEAYADLHWVHVLNNAALVTMSLSAGGDFEDSICRAVVGGWDTDSNGATVGSITGAVAGAHGLPDRWVQPLANRLSSSLPGFDGIGFDELARRTASLSNPAAMTVELIDPLIPRPIDLPTVVPLDAGADLSVLDDAKILAAPADPADLPRWRERLMAWRREARERIAYRDDLYADPAFDWIAGCFAVSLTWLWDEALYDHRAGVFRPDAFVESMERDFGGIDGVVLWHAYPIIGIDERDQFEFYRQVPDLSGLVQALQRRGVRVFVDYNPWDVAPGRSAADTPMLAQLVGDLGVDGVFLDTMREGAGDLRRALDAARPGVALEGESRLALARMHDHPMSWAQWFADSRPMPGVLRARWFERRHMVHHTRRWHRDHSEELHSAWLNGTGVLIWDDVFGSWVGWSDRDRSILRTMLSVQRRFRQHLTSEAWTPLADRPATATASHPIHASRFDHEESTLWTIVNTGDRAHVGALLSTEERPSTRWFELVSGRELAVEATDDRIELAGHLKARSIAAVLALPAAAVDDGLVAFLADQAAHPTMDDTTFPERPSARIVPAASASRQLRTGDVAEIPGGGRTMRFTYRLRETAMYNGAPFVNAWKPLPPRLHRSVTETRAVDIAPLQVARSQVSNGEFARFLDQTGYRPIQAGRFLAHWSNGRPDPGTEGQAVTHVDLDDARAYASWAGLRLPTEFEWQAAAEANALDHGEPRRWDLTESEHTNGRTRYLILKGGADHASLGSDWYVDGGPRPPDFSLKLLRAGAPVARSAWISFRCVADLGPGPIAHHERLTIERAPSSMLGGSIEYALYRPPTAAFSRIPTVYLLHGRGGTLSDWFEFTVRLDALISAGRIPPLLVVMPDAPWSERASWYVDSAFTGPAGYDGAARGRPVESALVRDLVDHVDATQPTIPSREARVVAGASMGGAGALGFCLGNPDRFASAVVIAPAVYEGLPPADSTTRSSGAFGRGEERFVESIYRASDPYARLMAAGLGGPIRLVFGSGDREPVRPSPAEEDHELLATTTSLHHRLRRLPGVDASLTVVPGGHDPSTWANVLEQGLTRLLGGLVVAASGEGKP